MRGRSEQQTTMLSLVGPEQRVPKDHPIRKIKDLADAELQRLSPIFDAMYGTTGRPSIPPEVLLKSQLLIALFSVRSERQFCERLDYDLMFRFFLDMSLVEKTFDASTFAKNRDRLMQAEVARLFFEAVVRSARESKLMSDDHFTVDGTLIEAYASLKSFRPKDEDRKQPPDDPGNPTVNFHGEKRSNETHASTTDPEARLAKKGLGKEAKLSYSAHVLMENRNGLCVDITVAPATGRAEREEALKMVGKQRAAGVRVATLGADKGYDARQFVNGLRELDVAPHVARYTKRSSAVDARTASTKSYAASQRARKKVEEIFGWMKVIGGFRKTRFRGVARNGFAAYLVGAAYNLLRLTKLLPA
jgi:transposase